MMTVVIPQTSPYNPDHAGSVLAVTLVDQNGAPVSVSGGSGGGGSSSGGTREVMFIQATPSSEWDIAHFMNSYPSVRVVDSNGLLGYPDVTYTDLNNVKLTFSVPYAGTAYLS